MESNSNDVTEEIKKEKKSNRKAIGITVIILLLIITLSSLLGNYYLLSMTNQKWEYKVVDVMPEVTNTRDGEGAMNQNQVTPSESTINELGKSGWELSSSYLETETAYPNFGNSQYVTGLQPNVRPQRLVMIFKRKLPLGNNIKQ